MSNISSNVSAPSNSIFKGNKNGIGQTLGKAAQNKQHINDLDSFACSLGDNKNKTGQSLDQSKLRERHSCSSIKPEIDQLQCHQHVGSDLRGNKNGKGFKIG